MPDKTNPRGVGLREDTEWKIIDDAAEKLGVTSHALAVYFMRYAIKQYQAGKLKIKTKQINALDMPS